MGQPARSAELRHHLYPDDLYGETPKLVMPGASPAASKAARLMVKLGIDGRGPQAEPVLPDDLAAGILRLGAMRLAADAAGFMVDVRLAHADGTGTVRAYYTDTLREVGLTIADKPPQTSGRIFNLQWVLSDDGLYEPQTPVHAGSSGPYLEACARVYDELWSSVMGVGAGPALEVVRARFTPYQPLP